jgi:hypothetical protein
MYYKTKWAGDRCPFKCKLSGKWHHPEVQIWVETQAPSDEIRYKDIDELMYQISEATFEGLAEGIAGELAKKIQTQGKVTVRVAEDPDFWVEAVEEK